MLPLSKCGNAGRIATWILGNIGDPLDHWQHGNGVTGAKSCVKLAIGDTVVTLENKWWGVRGSATQGHTPDPLLRLWEYHYFWAPVWLRESCSLFWATTAARRRLTLAIPFHWDQGLSAQYLRAAMPHQVY